MVPRHQGTGGTVALGTISKRGDTYLRTLLIHGARAVIAQVERKPEHSDPWLKGLLARRNQEHRGCGTGGEERTHRLGVAGP